MWKTDEKQNLKNAWLSKTFLNTGDRWRRGFWVHYVYHSITPAYVPLSIVQSSKKCKKNFAGCTTIAWMPTLLLQWAYFKHWGTLHDIQVLRSTFVYRCIRIFTEGDVQMSVHTFHAPVSMDRTAGQFYLIPAQNLHVCFCSFGNGSLGPRQLWLPISTIPIDRPDNSRITFATPFSLILT